MKLDRYKTFENNQNNDKQDLDSYLESIFSEFPNDAKSWAESTEELRDIARSAKEHYNYIDLNLIDDEVESGKGIQPLDFRKLNTPSEWNTKAKEYIKMVVNKMSDSTKEQFYDDIKDMFSFN